jgi:hypothetical protein
LCILCAYSGNCNHDAVRGTASASAVAIVLYVPFLRSAMLVHVPTEMAGCLVLNV